MSTVIQATGERFVHNCVWLPFAECMPVVQRQCPDRDSADFCGGPAVAFLLSRPVLEQGRCDPRSFIDFYVVTDAGPASHRVRLWQGACVHILPFSSPGIAFYGYKFSSSSSSGSSRISQGPLASPEAEGRWQWRSLRPLALLATVH